MTVNKLFRGLLPLLCLTFLLLSCKSVRQVTGEKDAGVTSAQEYFKSVLDNTPGLNTFSSKVRLTLNLDGKELTVSGNLKMKKNNAIQISVAPILGIEVARIEITPEYILAVDRMNKRYVQAPVSFLKELAGTNLDFYSLQALFFHELFLPGKQVLGVKDYTLFDFNQKTDGTTVIQPKKQADVNVCFVSATPDARLISCRIFSGGNFSFEWSYAGFQPFAGSLFPSLMDISVRDSGRKASVVMELSRLSQGKNENIRTEIPGKYQQVDIYELIKQLMKL